MKDSTASCCICITRKVTIFGIVILFLFPACSNNKPITSGRDIPIKKDSCLVDKIPDESGKKTVVVSTAGYDSTKTYIYLTLDDGPQKGTLNCYDILKSLDVKASFFMIGVHVDNDCNREEVNEIRNGYPEFLLCNHSFTHANYNHYHAYYNYPDSALRDIEKNQEQLRISEKIMRTPGNSSWVINGRIKAPGLTKPLCKLLDSAGYKAAGWDVEWRFKKGAVPVQSADRMISEVKRYADSKELFNAKNVVILVHDRMFRQQQYADSLKKFITVLKSDANNVFETIDHYPGMNTQIN